MLVRMQQTNIFTPVCVDGVIDEAHLASVRPSPRPPLAAHVRHFMVSLLAATPEAHDLFGSTFEVAFESVVRVATFRVRFTQPRGDLEATPIAMDAFTAVAGTQLLALYWCATPRCEGVSLHELHSVFRVQLCQQSEARPIAVYRLAPVDEEQAAGAGKTNAAKGSSSSA